MIQTRPYYYAFIKRTKIKVTVLRIIQDRANEAK